MQLSSIQSFTNWVCLNLQTLLVAKDVTIPAALKVLCNGGYFGAAVAMIASHSDAVTDQFGHKFGYKDILECWAAQDSTTAVSTLIAATPLQSLKRLCANFADWDVGAEKDRLRILVSEQAQLRRAWTPES